MNDNGPMTDADRIAERDRMTAIIEGARSQRRVYDDDPANQFPGEQDSQVFTVAAGPTWTDGSMSAPFTIRSVRIDNATTQWLQLGNGEWDFIPPFTFGRVFNVRGLGSIQVTRGVPPNGGIVQGAAVAGQFFKITVYDRPQYPQYGISGVLSATGAVQLQ